MSEPINLSPVLNAFATEEIPVTDLIAADPELAEMMWNGVDDMREHLLSLESGRYTVAEIRNADATYTVKLAAFENELPNRMMGIRVTDGTTNQLCSFVLFADLGEDQLIPIDFDVLASNDD